MHLKRVFTVWEITNAYDLLTLFQGCVKQSFWFKKNAFLPHKNKEYDILFFGPIHLQVSPFGIRTYIAFLLSSSISIVWYKKNGFLNRLLYWFFVFLALYYTQKLKRTFKNTYYIPIDTPPLLPLRRTYAANKFLPEKITHILMEYLQNTKTYCIFL